MIKLNVISNTSKYDYLKEDFKSKINIKNVDMLFAFWYNVYVKEWK